MSKQSMTPAIIKVLTDKPKEKHTSERIYSVLLVSYEGDAFVNHENVASRLKVLSDQKKIKRKQVYGLPHQFEYQAL